MRIESVKLTGFRNFALAAITLVEKTLVIGANDIGKTNLLHAIRILLDRTLSEADIEPCESDFHVSAAGEPSADLRIEIKLAGITEDAVISRLKGHISNGGETFLVYVAKRKGLTRNIFIGHSTDALEEVDGRHYLKHVHFKYVESSRNLNGYIQKEKRHLLKIAKQKRTTEQEHADTAAEVMLQSDLDSFNAGVNTLNYVVGATSGINDELRKISRHHSRYEVTLEAQSLNFATFVEHLSLGARSEGRRIGLGGDGRNNQILVGLWKAKSELEHDIENEAVIYCIEEPEAHLHPHQQRKLARYLVDELRGQVLVSTHAPQIASEFSPDGILRLLERSGSSVAASGGCSPCIDKAWKGFGYRMSILPAEAFFADAVLLVEGPSEVQFYQELARQLSLDLDFYNVSVLAVNGVAFDIYVAILDALEIPWSLRTDIDISRVPRSEPPAWRLTGLNRALKIAKEPLCEDYNEYERVLIIKDAIWQEKSSLLNPKGIYVSRDDLETDLGQVCEQALKDYAGTETSQLAIEFLKKRKAIHMGEFLATKGAALKALAEDELAKPLLHAVQQSRSRHGGKEPLES